MRYVIGKLGEGQLVHRGCLVDCIHPKPGDPDFETVEHFAPVAALRLSIELALRRTTSRSATRLAGPNAAHMHDLGRE